MLKRISNFVFVCFALDILQNIVYSFHRSMRHSPNSTNQHVKQMNSVQPSQFNNSPCKSFGNMIPTAVEVKLAASAPATSFFSEHDRSVSKPIDIMPINGVPTTPLKIERRKSNITRRNANVKYQAFGTPVDDPTMDEDFDFEKNLALFDKQAIWDEIDSTQKPGVVRQTISMKKKNFRHDENVILSKPTSLRQIKTDFQCCQEFANDMGLIIPSIPLTMRNQIQLHAERLGLSWERQCDMLARGTTDIALIQLGGARRLTPQNLHQWPTIVVICDQPSNERQSEVGLSTGRQLASHGLKITTYVPDADSNLKRTSQELELYMATGSSYSNTIKSI